MCGQNLSEERQSVLILVCIFSQFSPFVRNLEKKQKTTADGKSKDVRGRKLAQEMRVPATKRNKLHITSSRVDNYTTHPGNGPGQTPVLYKRSSMTTVKT